MLVDGGGRDEPPTTPRAGSTLDPACISQEYRPGAKPLEFQVHAIAGPTPAERAAKRPSGPLTEIVQGSADDSRPVNTTGPPILPRTTGANSLGRPVCSATSAIRSSWP